MILVDSCSRHLVKLSERAAGGQAVKHFESKRASLNAVPGSGSVDREVHALSV